jgi:hypothetical protein
MPHRFSACQLWNVNCSGKVPLPATGNRLHSSTVPSSCGHLLAAAISTKPGTRPTMILREGMERH